MNGVGDVHTLTLEADTIDKPIEQLTRSTYKRFSLLILGFAGRLSDDHHLRVTIPRTHDANGLASLIQFA
jgi:hypothetical protein